MENLILKQTTGNKFVLLLSTFLILQSDALGQVPQDVPKASDSEPLDLSNPTTLIFFIVLPLLFFGLYIFLRKKKKF